ncbi:hypothetical protein [Streptomyces sp. NPDC000880]
MGEGLLPPDIQPLTEQIRQPRDGDSQIAALAALSIAGKVLPVAQRQPYVALALAAARGEIQTPQDEEPICDHPLDRFRFRLGSPVLRQQGLVTAARLAGSDTDTAGSIVALAFTQLPHATDSEARLITRALSLLDPCHLPPLTALAVHQQPWVRCFAAHSGHAGGDTLELCRELLAADPDWRVRVNTAENLPDTHALLAHLRNDPNRRVRVAAGRA